MGFTVSENASSSAKLSAAILLYKNCANLSSRATLYATLHPVYTDKPGEPAQIGAGRPLGIGNLRKMCASLMDSVRFSTGVLSERILAVGFDYVVWWQPPGRQTHFFECTANADGGISVGKRSGLCLTPGIIFAAKGSVLMAFAVKGKHRPCAETPLFHLPAMNVWSHGQVCTGNVRLPKSSDAHSIEAWENAFWQSRFTHPNHPSAVRYKGGLHQFCIDLLDGKFKTYPQRVLNPIAGMTLSSLVGQLDDGKTDAKR